MLPKLSQPTFDVVVPTTKQKLKIRPMIVKEEKILLIAKQSDDKIEQFNAIRQICTNCIVSPSVDLGNFALVDLEYIFLKIRGFSISNKASVSYKDNEDEKVYTFEVDFDKVDIKQQESVQPVIQLSDGVSIQLRYPPVSLYADGSFFQLEDQQLFDRILLSSVVKIFQNDSVFDCSTIPQDELIEFINNIPAKYYQQFQQFFNSAPELHYVIEYTNSKQTPRKIELRTLDDFFIFG